MVETRKKAMFVHSHVFLYDSENLAYSEGKLTYETWKRYLNVFDELYVAGRYKNVDSTLHYNISSGKKVTHIKLPNINQLSSRLTNIMNTKKILLENMRNVDIVIVRLPSTHGELAVKLAKETRTPYVIELVGDIFSSLWFHGKFVGKLLAPIFFYRTRQILKRAPYVLYVTENFLQKKYPSMQLKVTESCSNVEINPSLKFEEFDKKAEDVFKIGLIGSYSSKYKGIDNALNVLKKLIENNKKVELHILGSGDAQMILNIVKDLNIDNYVKLDGSLPGGEKVYEWLSGLDLYIQPSLTEGLPRALIEAMFCKLPCIASNVGGIPELLDVDYLHNPKDENRMFQLINEMYENENLRVTQSRLNHEKALEYSKDVLDTKRNDFWKSVLEDIQEAEK